MKNDIHVDLTAIVGLVIMGVIGAMSVNHGGAEGMTVAAGAVGAIGGWLAKSATRVTTTTEGDPTVRTTAEQP